MTHEEAIKGLHIEGFQSHVDTRVDFAGPGQLTVLVGDGGRGKTSVARALRWVTCNSPSGDSFINWHTNSAKVTLEMLSGFQVIRERTRGGTNRYIVVSPNGERQVFEGFGASVPEEIKRITGISEVAIGDLKLNLNMAGQLDGPFLGSTITGGQRARILGALAGTEEIDMAIRTAATDANRREQDRRRAVTGAEGATRRLEEYKHLPRMLARLQAVELLIKRIEEVGAEKKQAEELWDQIQEAAKKVLELQLTLDRYQGAPEALVHLESLRVEVAHTNTLCILDADGIRHRGEVAYNRDLVRKLAGVDQAIQAIKEAGRVESEAIHAVDAQEDYRKAKSSLLAARRALEATDGLTKAWPLLEELTAVAVPHVRQLNGLDARQYLQRSTVDNHSQAAAAAASNEKAALAEYKDLLNKLGICPTCGQEIKEVCIHG